MAAARRQSGRKWEGIDPDTVMSLARYLGKCKSTADLSCTAVALLSKTLTARATRLESTASRVHVAAEKERYRRTSASKRRRASGPKNMSQFMRETIRNRKSQGKVRVAAARLKSQDRLNTPAHPDDDSSSSRDPFQKCTNDSTSSRIMASFVVPPRVEKVYNDGRSRCSTFGMTKQHRPTNLNGAQTAAGGVGGAPPHRCTSPPDGSSKGKFSQRLKFSPRREKCDESWSLENDADIRLLLERAHYHPDTASNNRPATAGHAVAATSGGNNCSAASRRTRPSSSRCVNGRSQTRTGAIQDVRSTVSLASKDAGAMLSSQTNFDGPRRGRRFLQQHTMTAGGERARSDMVQIRRDMLIHSHGQGLNAHEFAQDQFEATAMGRRSTCGRGPILDRSQRVRWLPAKTLDGLDRLERSRMLINKRPVVTSLHVWT